MALKRSRRKHKKVKKRTKRRYQKGGESGVECERRKRMKLYQGISKVLEEMNAMACKNPKSLKQFANKVKMANVAVKRNQPAVQEDSFTGEDMNNLFYDGTCSDKSDCQKHEPFLS